jgi:hypothetical protein
MIVFKIAGFAVPFFSNFLAYGEIKKINTTKKEITLDDPLCFEQLEDSNLRKTMKEFEQVWDDKGKGVKSLNQSFKRVILAYESKLIGQKSGAPCSDSPAETFTRQCILNEIDKVFESEEQGTLVIFMDWFFEKYHENKNNDILKCLSKDLNTIEVQLPPFNKKTKINSQKKVINVDWSELSDYVKSLGDQKNIND